MTVNVRTRVVFVLSLLCCYCRRGHSWCNTPKTNVNIFHLFWLYLYKNKMHRSQKMYSFRKKCQSQKDIVDWLKLELFWEQYLQKQHQKSAHSVTSSRTRRWNPVLKCTGLKLSKFFEMSWQKRRSPPFFWRRTNECFFLGFCEVAALNLTEDSLWYRICGSSSVMFEVPRDSMLFQACAASLCLLFFFCFCLILAMMKARMRSPRMTAITVTVRTTLSAPFTVSSQNCPRYPSVQSHTRSVPPPAGGTHVPRPLHWLSPQVGRL